MLKNLHHANLLLGTREEAESYVRSLCGGLGINLANNPDFLIFRSRTFGIDEVRELKSISARKAVSSRKIFLVSPAHLTLEAQNALLKIFEDPFPLTHFFLALKEKSLIIATLLSRMNVIHLAARPPAPEAAKFLSLTLRDRLLFARKFTDEEGDVSNFIDGLLDLLRREKASTGLLRGVHNVRRLASDSTGASRLLIEHLSLVL